MKERLGEGPNVGRCLATGCWTAFLLDHTRALTTGERRMNWESQELWGARIEKDPS